MDLGRNRSPRAAFDLDDHDGSTVWCPGHKINLTESKPQIAGQQTVPLLTQVPGRHPFARIAEPPQATGSGQADSIEPTGQRIS